MKRNATAWICALLTLSSVIALPIDNAAASGPVASALIKRQAAPRAVIFIHDVYELQNMSRNLSGNYELASDINASETSGWNKRAGFAPVGNQTAMFNGTLDGRDFRISNLYIARSKTDYTGLFGFCGRPSRIGNVSLLRATVSGNSGVGALAGTSLGAISNCSSSGSVDGTAFSGGLVGLLGDSSLSGCSSTASASGDNMTGGLLGGAMNATISDCSSKGPVNGMISTGGLAGYCIMTTVARSFSSGTVNGGYYITGGLVGAISDSAVSDCYSSAPVTGIIFTGGLVGSSSNGNITNCSSNGTVNGKLVTGGLAGYCLESTVSRSRSLGTVNGEYSIAGGLAGNITDSKISRCYSTAPVTCPNYTAGLVGQSGNGAISDSYCTGAVTGKNMTGGLAGAIGAGGLILNCYSTGTVTGTQYFGGGGGVVGVTDRTVNVTASYYDAEASGCTYSAAGTARTTAEMMLKKNFNKWDFTITWGIFEKQTYPFLLCFYTPPGIQGADDPSVDEDAPYSVHYKASFSRYPLAGNALDWAFSTDASGWLAFNSSSGNLSGTPDNSDVGVYRVNLSATDDLNYTSWRNFTLRVENVPPVFTDLPPDNITLKQDEIWSFDVNCSDEGVGNTSYGMELAPAWINIDRAGVISGRPGHNDMGNYSLTLFADDGWGVRITYDLVLVVVSDNTPPTITTRDVLTATQGIPYSVRYQAADIDPEDKTFLWALATNATWLMMHSSTGVLSGTPGAPDVGSWAVNVTVVDERGGRDSSDFVLTVLRTNAPPVLRTPAIPSATKGVLYQFSLNATDPDIGDALSWSLNTTAGWLSIGASTGALSGTPGESDVGSFAVNITVKDQAGATDSVAYTIRVLTVNGPPVWVSAPGNTSIPEGQRFLFTMQANDPDGDPVQYRVSSQPACGINIDLALGELGWQDPVAGEYAVNVSAAAGQFTIYHAFVLTVKSQVSNIPPSIKEIANASARAGQAFSIRLEGSDPDSWDAANLTFRLVSGPAGMVVSAEGSVLWNPTKEQVGKQTVTVRLSDGKNSTTATFSITVNPETESDPSGIPTGASLAWMVLIPVVCYVYRRYRQQ